MRKHEDHDLSCHVNGGCVGCGRRRVRAILLLPIVSVACTNQTEGAVLCVDCSLPMWFCLSTQLANEAQETHLLALTHFSTIRCTYRPSCCRAGPVRYPRCVHWSDGMQAVKARITLRPHRNCLCTPLVGWTCLPCLIVRTNLAHARHNAQHRRERRMDSVNHT